MSNTNVTQGAGQVTVVRTWKVACDGGEGALGHPRVWLSLAQDKGRAICGYCDRVYEIDRAHAQGDH